MEAETTVGIPPGTPHLCGKVDCPSVHGTAARLRKVVLEGFRHVVCCQRRLAFADWKVGAPLRGRIPGGHNRQALRTKLKARGITENREQVPKVPRASSQA